MVVQPFFSKARADKFPVEFLSDVCICIYTCAVLFRLVVHFPNNWSTMLGLTNERIVNHVIQFAHWSVPTSNVQKVDNQSEKHSNCSELVSNFFKWACLNDRSSGRSTMSWHCHITFLYAFCSLIVSIPLWSLIKTWPKLCGTTWSLLQLRRETTLTLLNLLYALLTQHFFTLINADDLVPNNLVKFTVSPAYISMLCAVCIGISSPILCWPEPLCCLTQVLLLYSTRYWLRWD